MANGIYIGMSGAIAAQRRLDVVANNVANANTPGFRQQRAQFETFLVQTNDQRPIEKGFVAATATHTDDSAGAIMQTGNPLDVAIDGKGWFMVKDANGQSLLTRSGNFAPPVSLFHSSNVSGEILPSTRSCANLRRWAWLLNGMSV